MSDKSEMRCVKYMNLVLLHKVRSKYKGFAGYQRKASLWLEKFPESIQIYLSTGKWGFSLDWIMGAL